MQNRTKRVKKMFSRFTNDPKTVRKFIAALIGAALVAVSQGLLPPEVGNYLTVAVAFLTALGVYVVPNKRDGRATSIKVVKIVAERDDVNE